MKKQKNSIRNGNVRVNRKGSISILVKIGLAVLLFLVIVFVFLNPNFWSGLSDKFRNLFNPPETDPLPWQKEGRQDQKSALLELKRVYSAFEAVNKSQKQLCFGAFQALDSNFFDKGFAIHIYPGTSTNGKAGISFIAVQYSKGDPSGDAFKSIDTWTPVSTELFLEGVEPCLVYGADKVKNFYTDFLDKSAPLPAAGRAKEYGAKHNFWLSSSEKILVSSDNDKIIDYAPGGFNNNYYILKHGNNLCLLPSEGTIAPGCNEPGTSDALLDNDCLDNFETGQPGKLPGLLRTGFRLAGYACDGFEYLNMPDK